MELGRLRLSGLGRHNSLFHGTAVANSKVLLQDRQVVEWLRSSSAGKTCDIARDFPTFFLRRFV